MSTPFQIDKVQISSKWYNNCTFYGTAPVTGPWIPNGTNLAQCFSALPVSHRLFLIMIRADFLVNCVQWFTERLK